MLVVTFQLPAEAFALERTLHDLPEIEIEADRLAAHSTEWTMPDIWVAGVAFDRVDEALGDDPTVERVIDSEEFDDEKFYHLEWGDDLIDRIDAYVDMGGSILNASASGDGWVVRIRFAHREQFADFRDYVREEGHSFEVMALTEPEVPRQAVGRLTPRQRDALVAAMEEGYFEVPRRTTAEELADQLEISQQALSERLRRATGNLVDSTLTTSRRAGHGE